MNDDRIEKLAAENEALRKKLAGAIEYTAKLRMALDRARRSRNRAKAQATSK